MRWLLLTVALFGLGACAKKGTGEAGAGKAQAMGPTVQEVRTGQEAMAALRQRVRIRGKAVNAKLSAAVVRPGLVVYLIEKQAWAKADIGHDITVTGVLELTSAHKAMHGPMGEISQGAGSAVWILRRAKITRTKRGKRRP